MRAQLVQIGNSRGVRLPKPFIQECRLGDDVELAVKNRTIVISPVQTLRNGWDEAFGQMHTLGDDHLLDPEKASNWDDEEWEWQ